MAGRHERKKTPTPNVRNNTQRPDNKKTRRKKLLLFSIPVALLVLGGGAYYGLTKPLSGDKGVLPFTIAGNPQDKGRINVLLIGTDTRPGEQGGNTDVLVLASIDNPNHRIEMLSIPRDTRVTYPDGSAQKINESLNVGGPQLTVNLVEQLLHMKIDNYAVTHFGGLVDVINTLGGITVDVKERMLYNTGDKEYNIIDLQPGVQTLNGSQALGFVRFRHDALGDIGRTQRQQEFLTALAHKLFQSNNITKLPTLVQEFSKTVDTNMSLMDIGGLATGAKEYKDYKIIHETLPGSFENPAFPTSVSYWWVNTAQSQYVARQFFYNGIVQQNPIQDPNVTVNWSPPRQSTSSTSGSATSNRTSSGQNQTNTTGASSTIAPIQSGNLMVVTGETAHVRSGAGTQYDILTTLVKGQSVNVVGHSGVWDQVVLSGGTEGYIASWLLGPSN